MSTGEPAATESGHGWFGGGPSEKDQLNWHLVGGLPYITSGSAGGRAEKDQPRLAPRRAAHPTAWISKHRRTIRDYERLPAHHEAMVYWPMIIIMGRRLARRREPALPRAA
jgi:hypothetical protein